MAARRWLGAAQALGVVLFAGGLLLAAWELVACGLAAIIAAAAIRTHLRRARG